MSYTVKKGDNLTKIAKQHGLTLQELMKLNNISQDQANRINIGQKLKVSSNPIGPQPFKDLKLAKKQKSVEQQPVKQLVKKQQPIETKSEPQIFGAGPEYAVMAQAQMYKENPDSSPNINKLIKDVTPRQYTAAQNTVSDLIKAPIKRGIGSLLGSKVANFVMPPEEYNENHISSELYNWLQDAIEQKWPLAERQKYFETNPDARVEKGWKGRITGTNTKQSDYQKYYGTAYTGPMKYGFKETMFGDGLPQAQGTLGSFNIVYTKDGAYIQDDWDFGTGKNFNTDTLMGTIRSAAEKFGSQENDELTPTRKLNAFIKYRN